MHVVLGAGCSTEAELPINADRCRGLIRGPMTEEPAIQDGRPVGTSQLGVIIEFKMMGSYVYSTSRLQATVVTSQVRLAGNI